MANRKIVYQVTLIGNEGYTAYDIIVELREQPEKPDSADENYVRWLRQAIVRGIEEDFKPYVTEWRRVYGRRKN